MKYRKLRIAWSIVCGISCLHLYEIWVRSYQSSRIFSLWTDLWIASAKGRFHIGVWRPSNQLDSWELTGTGQTVPIWLLAVLIGTASVIPWIRWRFGLRTLLIVTTLVAVGLGFIVLL